MVDTDSNDDNLPATDIVTVKEREEMDIVDVDAVSWLLRMRPNVLYRFNRRFVYAGYPMGAGGGLFPRVHILHGKKENVSDLNVGL